MLNIRAPPHSRQSWKRSTMVKEIQSDHTKMHHSPVGQPESTILWQTTRDPIPCTIHRQRNWKQSIGGASCLSPRQQWKALKTKWAKGVPDPFKYLTISSGQHAKGRCRGRTLSASIPNLIFWSFLTPPKLKERSHFDPTVPRPKFAVPPRCLVGRTDDEELGKGPARPLDDLPCPAPQLLPSLLDTSPFSSEKDLAAGLVVVGLPSWTAPICDSG